MGSCNILGSLKHRVTIQNPTYEADGQGGFTETWEDAVTVWASMETVKSFERYQAMQMQVPISHKMIVRYTTELSESSRIKFGTRYFSVKEVINKDNDNRYLFVKAIELDLVIETDTSGISGLDFSDADNSAYAAII